MTQDKTLKARSTIQLAWFGSADVRESEEEIRNIVCTNGMQKDLGSTTLTLTDGSPIHFYNNHFVSVIKKNAILYE
jgi:hypothetical protein